MDEVEDGDDTEGHVARPSVVSRWRIRVVAGPASGAMIAVESGSLRVGSSSSSDLMIRDERVSRRHLELLIGSHGVRVHDLGSRNGTYFAGSKIVAVQLPEGGGRIELGASAIEIRPDREADSIRWSGTRCGRLVGDSAAMRDLFARIERVAPRNATVLVQGETGTGKELVAEAIHAMGPRRRGPFVVVDCGAIAPNLVESALFGHVRGAFTDATHDRRGAFAQADGGTLLLDEIGELDLALQPKLLRALETGEIRPLGAEKTSTCDVRVVAASHRDLHEAVLQGRFREDLYYRLAVVHLHVPPLRARDGDVPLLVRHFLDDMGAPPLDADSLALLAAHPWPGNVRQLRNVLEHAVTLAGDAAPVIRPQDLDVPATFPTGSRVFFALPYKEAKGKMVEQFTRDYLEALLARHPGNVSAAAREAKIDRNWLVELARRHGLRAD
jgi:DNA-binding NtrC family response regulator